MFFIYIQIKKNKNYCDIHNHMYPLMMWQQYP